MYIIEIEELTEKRSCIYRNKITDIDVICFYSKKSHHL